MLRKPQNMRGTNLASRGFTLIELLIVVAVIGILAALLIPNLLDGLQKAKQKRTMADIKLVGTATMSWLTDQAGGAAAAGVSSQVDLNEYPVIAVGDLENLLIPNYIQEIPVNDAWRMPLDLRLNLADLEARELMAFRSNGRDGAPMGDTYTAMGFDPTDYDQDIVWADGGFVRFPQREAP